MGETSRRLHLTVGKLAARPVAAPIEGGEHVSAEVARFFDHGAYRVFVEPVERSGCQKFIEPTCGLESKEDVVYWSLIGHRRSFPVAASDRGLTEFMTSKHVATRL